MCGVLFIFCSENLRRALWKWKTDAVIIGWELVLIIPE